MMLARRLLRNWQELSVVATQMVQLHQVVAPQQDWPLAVQTAPHQTTACTR